MISISLYLLTVTAGRATLLYELDASQFVRPARRASFKDPLPERASRVDGPSQVFTSSPTLRPRKSISWNTYGLPASVANKRLTVRLSPLDAILTKNRGRGQIDIQQLPSAHDASPPQQILRLFSVCGPCPDPVGGVNSYSLFELSTFNYRLLTASPGGAQLSVN
jgi:hypothetical protein